MRHGLGERIQGDDTVVGLKDKQTRQLPSISLASTFTGWDTYSCLLNSFLAINLIPFSINLHATAKMIIYTYKPIRSKPLVLLSSLPVHLPHLQVSGSWSLPLALPVLSSLIYKDKQPSYVLHLHWVSASTRTLILFHSCQLNVSFPFPSK